MNPLDIQMLRGIACGAQDSAAELRTIIRESALPAYRKTQLAEMAARLDQTYGRLIALANTLEDGAK